LANNLAATFIATIHSIKETLPITKIEVNIPITTFETAIANSNITNPFSVDYLVVR